MRQFLPRYRQPLRPDSYRRLARLARGYLDRIEALSDAHSPHEKRNRTMALTGLMRLVRSMWERNKL